ncbi:MAG: acyl-ACP--UDP-N-acetylglucosamine O-acyltransferase [Muribaculaceae bacterium]|nr:acyl-ACP--UDP-N-acetylglucosamine O-acyltransferase [Muribaculaceae bacterium]MCI6495012.1 acyl-ACP--UDP-N-acetylglucosamine O-acyltransferase [Bacteroidales bacterium]MDD6942666.1 acyl-ACP--UDP-N-acetylglucosamine O-acyltransferase [Bacteroidales bacterium]MDY2732757.1 acyl-ACP--UDP-N-acetylglucosamine O-acyltransferase [Muribaculaceae bacterium]MDY4650082.1 acyl-ACP--UDP-N-acetylglucosamine O-acyltransferase [Muribaculaceae bacterium]
MSNFYKVSPDAQIGNNVRIGDFSTIYEDVEIGDNCVIYGNVTIFPGARIGDGVTIFPGAVIAAVPQDLKFQGEKTYAYIGDGTTLRECVTVNRGTASKGKTVVGKNCLIMAYNHIAHDCRLGDRIIMSNACQLAGEVQVDDAAVIGGGSLIHQFCHLGRNIMLQGGALVNKDIPPFVKAAREPISYVGLNTVGLHRNHFTEEEIKQISDIYRILYLSDLNVTNAIQQIVDTLPESEFRTEIVDFITNSGRGVIRSAI